MRYPLYHLANLRADLNAYVKGFGTAVAYETLRSMGYSGTAQQVLEQVTADLKAELLQVVRSC